MTVWSNSSPVSKIRHVLQKACLCLLLVVFITSLFFNTSTQAAPSTAKVINFSARLKTPQGGIVPDGFYNIRFQIYDQEEGGSPLWTEVHHDANGAAEGQDNRVRVANGYLSAKLGSITTFGTAINWDDDLWLTLDIGGVTQSADIPSIPWDGEMNPRIQLTAVPYAISAGSIGGKTADQLIHLGQGVQTDSSSGTSSIFINKTGSGNLIELQSAGVNTFTLDSKGSIVMGSAPEQSISLADTQSGAGGNLTIAAGSSKDSSSGNGGNLTLVGGSSGGNGSGGSISIDAGETTAAGGPEETEETIILSDDFSTKDTQKWDYYSPRVSLVSGQLSIVPNTNYEGLYSAQDQDLTSSSMTVQMTQVPNIGNGSTSASFGAEISSGNGVYTTWENGDLIFQEYVAGTPTEVYIPYNAVDHAWLRIREDNGIIYWDTSPDSINWTNRRTKELEAGPLNSVIVSLFAGRWAAEPTPGTARFDNFSLTKVTTKQAPSNGGISIGAANAGSISIGNSSSTTTVSGKLRLDNLDTSESGVLNIGEQNATSISLGQDTVVRNSLSDSSTTFQVQGVDGKSRLSVDTLNNRVKIGTNDIVTTLMMLDTKTTEGDPTGANGAMYYNSYDGKFRCFEAGQWVDCITPLPVSRVAETDTTNQTTAPINVTDMGFPLSPDTKYHFKFVILHESENELNGVGFGVTTPNSPVISNWCVNTTATLGSASGHWGSYCGIDDAVVTTSGGVGIGTKFTSTMEGYIETGSESGTLQLRLKSELNEKSIVKSGSFGILQIVK